jgi:hypothetical protein
MGGQRPTAPGKMLSMPTGKLTEARSHIALFPASPRAIAPGPDGATAMTSKLSKPLKTKYLINQWGDDIAMSKARLGIL